MEGGKRESVFIKSYGDKDEVEDIESSLIDSEQLSEKSKN